MKRIKNRLGFMYKNLNNKLNWFDPNLSEEENCKVNGLFRVYGRKQKKWIFEKN